ncbi:hypothetical protein CYV19_18605 [Natronobacterium gregoryi SP2]|uniref:Uncharacterized protein n=3 Tax=Natronobacterium gregoryi TaxID=44930 RepID=L9XVG3_NATGS|nr:hypothetical protein C490_14555 [Natronobacterium gregoryi SP2]PLK18157.1 hypothetical protein CYV19_18605 [Natronobacterium gregoryi SP2]
MLTDETVLEVQLSSSRHSLCASKTMNRITTGVLVLVCLAGITGVVGSPAGAIDETGDADTEDTAMWNVLVDTTTSDAGDEANVSAHSEVSVSSDSTETAVSNETIRDGVSTDSSSTSVSVTQNVSQQNVSVSQSVSVGEDGAEVEQSTALNQSTSASSSQGVDGEDGSVVVSTSSDDQ